MRRRLALVLILGSAAAGCSLLVEFDRGKLGPLDVPEDATADVGTSDSGADVSTSEGGGNVDAGSDATLSDAGDAGDAASEGGTDTADAGTDATDGATVSDAKADSSVDSGVDAAVDAGADAADAEADAGPDAEVDAGSDASPDSGPDGGLSANCTDVEFDANDQTAQALVTVTFPTGASPADYSPKCVKVKVGTIVRWSGSFASHPLQNGGSIGSPIPAVTSVASDGGDIGELEVTFPAVGTFDYNCAIHGSAMPGSVRVVP